MKINDLYSNSQSVGAQQTQRSHETDATEAAGKAKTTATKGVSSNDEVSLSSLASVLQDAIGETPERAAYLERLAKEFEAGTYQPDARAVARSLVDETLLDDPSAGSEK